MQLRRRYFPFCVFLNHYCTVVILGNLKEICDLKSFHNKNSVLVLCITFTNLGGKRFKLHNQHITSTKYSFCSTTELSQCQKVQKSDFQIQQIQWNLLIVNWVLLPTFLLMRGFYYSETFLDLLPYNNIDFIFTYQACYH